MRDWEWGTHRTDVLLKGPRLPVGSAVTKGARALSYKKLRGITHGEATLAGILVQRVRGGAWIRIRGPVRVKIQRVRRGRRRG